MSYYIKQNEKRTSKLFGTSYLKFYDALTAFISKLNSEHLLGPWYWAGVIRLNKLEATLY